MSTKHLRALAVASACAVLAVTAGCTSTKHPVGTAAPAVHVVTGTPAPTPSELSPEDQAQADAEEAVREYFRVSNETRHDPEKFLDWQEVETVATDTALSDLEQSLVSLWQQGAHQVGDLKVEWIQLAPDGVDLTDNQTITPPDVPNVQFRVCYDVSQVDSVTSDGKSVTQPGRKDRAVFQIGVTNYQYPSGPWLVGWVQQTEETC